jgi:hypothetical protein
MAEGIESGRWNGECGNIRQRAESMGQGIEGGMWPTASPSCRFYPPACKLYGLEAEPEANILSEA